LKYRIACRSTPTHRDADDLTSAHLERDTLNRGQAALVEDVEVLHLQEWLTEVGGLLLDVQEHLAPEIKCCHRRHDRGDGRQ